MSSTCSICFAIFVKNIYEILTFNFSSLIFKFPNHDGVSLWFQFCADRVESLKGKVMINCCSDDDCYRHDDEHCCDDNQTMIMLMVVLEMIC